jgi:hypothetical protein
MESMIGDIPWGIGYCSEEFGLVITSSVRVLIYDKANMICAHPVIA